uniref:Candidate secreted effector n=1 Tax=Meloidogyne incognita TaxID=6306 RepID=A0A914N781_MELIC
MIFSQGLPYNESTSGSSIDSNTLNSNNNGGNGNNLNGSCSISGGLISGLTIASNGSGNWSTRGVGGIGAGLSCSSASSSPFHVGGGLFGGDVGLQIGGGGFGQIKVVKPQEATGCLSAYPLFKGGGSSGGGGLFNNCGCSSSDYGLFKK